MNKGEFRGKKQVLPAILLACAMGVGTIPAAHCDEPPGARTVQTQSSESQLEARARAIGKQLRCVVCQNQTIDESDATLAADMRSLVLERLRAGDSDAQVIDYIRQRYGDFVLMKPPVKRDTWALWGGPLAFLLLGTGLFALTARRRKNLSTPEKNSEEIADILKKYED